MSLERMLGDTWILCGYRLIRIRTPGCTRTPREKGFVTSSVYDSSRESVVRSETGTDAWNVLENL